MSSLKQEVIDLMTSKLVEAYGESVALDKLVLSKPVLLASNVFEISGTVRNTQVVVTQPESETTPELEVNFFYNRLAIDRVFNYKVVDLPDDEDTTTATLVSKLSVVSKLNLLPEDFQVSNVVRGVDTEGEPTATAIMTAHPESLGLFGSVQVNLVTNTTGGPIDP